MKILVDTNIFLDFYRYERETVELLKELESHSDKLIFTQQIVDEFNRNREKVLQQVKGTFEGASQLANIPTSIVSDDAEIRELKRIRKEYDSHRKKVVNKISKLINDENEDPVARIFNNLTIKARSNGNFWKINEIAIKNAQNRKLLGNPPISEDKSTLGDELTWELLLENSNDDIVMITRDGTYTTFASYLKNEYKSRTGKQIIAIKGNIKDGLKAAGLEISPKLNDIEELMVPESSTKTEYNPATTNWRPGGRYDILRRTNGEYQFILKADNGQVILSSEGYTAKSGCRNGIELVRKNASDDANYDRLTATNGKYYFRLKTANSQVIALGQMYESASGRDSGIERVKKTAPDAPINDES